MHRIFNNNKHKNSSFKIILHKDDPFDEKIIKLVGSGDLKIRLVELNDEEKLEFDKYSKKSLKNRGRHSS